MHIFTPNTFKCLQMHIWIFIYELFILMSLVVFYSGVPCRYVKNLRG